MLALNEMLEGKIGNRGEKARRHRMFARLFLPPVIVGEREKRREEGRKGGKVSEKIKQHRVF